MTSIRKVESLDNLSDLKEQYISRTTAPLDGMWLTGFVPMAEHYRIYVKDNIAGYFCINEEGYLLQFHMLEDLLWRGGEILNSMLKGSSFDTAEIKGAFVSTAEPEYLSLCLESFPNFKVHTLMYQLSGNAVAVLEPPLALDSVQAENLAELVDFTAKAIEAPVEWLTGYYTNLIKRQELFVYREDGQVIAAGESRGYDEYQSEYADLGFVVSPLARGKGLGTRVLNQLIEISRAKGLKPICSTEWSNIGAQKAIHRAGFFPANRIVQFDN
jgi:GNAT superfamily N-acetyltransferase